MEYRFLFIGNSATYVHDLPATLAEVGITDETHFEKMAEKAAGGCIGGFVPLSKEDIIGIYRAAK